MVQELTSARSVWGAVWTGRETANLRGNQLLVLIEDANQITHSVVALVELLAISIVYEIKCLHCAIERLQKSILK
ncbi:MAG: hypothetical protein ACBR15_00080 [Microcoleus sp.]